MSFDIDNVVKSMCAHAMGISFVMISVEKEAPIISEVKDQTSM